MGFMKYFRSARNKDDKTSSYVMGAESQKQKLNHRENKMEKKPYQQIDLEKYFRPIRRSILNHRPFGYQFFDLYYEKTYDEVELPPSLLDTPENMLLNYFSILREAENLQ